MNSNKMDDRAYTAALASWALMIERRKNITEKRKPKDSIQDFKQLFQFHEGKKITRYR